MEFDTEEPILVYVLSAPKPVLYVSESEIVLRGCSSNRKMFHVECESHLSGGSNIQFCYCGYDLCNQISGAGGRVGVLGGLASLAMTSWAWLS